MSLAMVVSPYVLIDKPREGPLNSWAAAYQEQVLFLFNSASEQSAQQTQRCRSRPMTPLKMSKLKSKTRRTSHLTSSVGFLRVNSWKIATLSQTKISRRSPPCTWCVFCRAGSLSPPSANLPRSMTATGSAASVCLPASPCCQLPEEVWPHQQPAP